VSNNIRDLRDLVTLSAKSPAQSPRPASPWTPQSPLAERTGQAPPQLARLGERSFARTQSAPASAAFFSRLNGANQESSSSSRGPLLPAPRMGQGLGARQNSSVGRRFARSKTGAVALSRTQPNIDLNLSQNLLTR
jgi:hypothetical protein